MKRRAARRPLLGLVNVYGGGGARTIVAGAIVATAIVAGAVVAGAGCGRRSPPAAGHARDARSSDVPGEAGDAATAATAARAPTAVLDSVQVELHGRVEHVLDGRGLGRSFARCLIESGAPVVALAEQALPGEVVRHLALVVDVTAHDPARGQPDLGVSLDAIGHWVDAPQAPAPSATLTGAATPRRGSHPDVDPIDAAAAAVTIELEPRLCELQTTRLTIWATDDLRPALGSSDPSLVRWALTVAAERGPGDDAVARAALIEAIGGTLSGEPDVLDAAIAALVALGDRRAVNRLTAIADLGDDVTLVRIIDAVTRLGGDDARDFLQVMTSHHDADVARAARLGLAALALDEP
jgi:hypothetical protein